MFNYEILALVISLVFIFVGLFISIREVLVVYYNPLIKIDNGTDKDLSKIDLIKTRSILSFQK